VSQSYHFVQVAPCFVDLKQETGGVANVVRQICLILRQRGHQVTLICSNTELGRVVADPAIYISSEGVAVHIVAQNGNPLVGPARNVTKALKQAHQTGGSALIVGHIHTCFSCHTETAMNFFSKHSIPFVFSPHGKLSPNMFGRRQLAKLAWWWLFARRNVMHANYIGLLAESESVLFEKLRLSVPKVVIPNGFQVGHWQCSELSNLPPSYIIYLGYLDPRKQPDFLVKAYSRTKASKTHKLLLVGPDSYNFKKKIMEVAIQREIAESVIFWGAAYGDDKWHLLHKSTCLCLPSLGEGHPIVLCEALGAGIPSIYSIQCNFPEVDARGAGIELDNFDEMSWANAIDKIVLNKSIGMTMRKSAAFMAKEYTWDAAIRKWEAIYFKCHPNKS
jgi:glycosyltransferase involved in cell wall biosynthesis